MTPSTMPFAAAERQLSDPALERLVRDIGVPPQPAVIASLRTELGREEPDLRRVAAAVARAAAPAENVRRDRSGLPGASLMKAPAWLA
jgi:hypothetical protein